MERQCAFIFFRVHGAEFSRQIQRERERERQVSRVCASTWRMQRRTTERRDDDDEDEDEDEVAERQERQLREKVERSMHLQV